MQRRSSSSRLWVMTTTAGLAMHPTSGSRLHTEASPLGTIAEAAAADAAAAEAAAVGRPGRGGRSLDAAG